MSISLILSNVLILKEEAEEELDDFQEHASETDGEEEDTMFWEDEVDDDGDDEAYHE